MKKFFLLPLLASVVGWASSTPFSNNNPYEEISTIERKQIKGENFVEVYENQNNIDHTTFDFFGLLSSADDQQVQTLCDPNIPGDCDPTDIPLPSPINQYELFLGLLGLGIILKRKFY